MTWCVRWLIRTKHFQESKTLPRIQKHFPESKTLPRIQNTSQNSKHFPESKTISQNLDSGKCFWILGSVLNSGKCFGFWKVFLDSGKCFVLTSHRRCALKADPASRFLRYISFTKQEKVFIYLHSRSPHELPPQSSKRFYSVRTSQARMDMNWKTKENHKNSCFGVSQYFTLIRTKTRRDILSLSWLILFSLY